LSLMRQLPALRAVSSCSPPSRTTEGCAVDIEMDSRLFEARADDLVLQVFQPHLISAEFDVAVAEESQKIPERTLARIFRRGDVQDPGVVGRHPVTQLLPGVLELLRMAVRADR